MSDLTRVLQSVEQGDVQAAEQLLLLVYHELRKLAAARMAHEAPGQTLQPTAPVHEAWLRLAGSDRQQWRGRAADLGSAPSPATPRDLGGVGGAFARWYLAEAHRREVEQLFKAKGIEAPSID